MFQKVTTLTEFILEEEHQSKGATGSLTLLLTQIENAGKIIASHIKRTGLVDILGKTGSTNTYGDEVEKFDEYANALLIDTLVKSRQVYEIASEELEKPIAVPNSNGHYSVFFDPIDGSSNIDVNITLGTIFSIYRKQDHVPLQSGNKQIAAGYIIYGSSVMFVLTTGNGVNGFTLDPAIGSFLLSHPNMKIPASGKIYSINEAYWNNFDEKIKAYLTFLKANPASLRYAASMVADVHRILLKGGIFIYPADDKHPSGKLRLMFEVNPLSFIVEQAGGQAYSTSGSPLSIKPEKIEQTVPIALGSAENIKDFVRLST